MKSIMISIQPQFVEKILNGTKTIEIRKTKPKCELPCKVYIYCKQGQMLHDMKEEEYWTGKRFAYGSGKSNNVLWSTPPFVNGKVVAEFTLNKVSTYDWDIDFLNTSQKMYYIKSGEAEKTCLTYEELCDYGKGNILYGWHIDNLKIYDNPKELSEFSGFIPNNKCEKHENGFACDKCDAYDKEYDTCLALYYCHKPIKRPFQSWGYVEELKNE